MREAGDGARIAVVVPVRNEAASARALAARLAALRGAAELCVVDGESCDGSLDLIGDGLGAARAEVAIARGARGRARQMNLGARSTRAPVLLFLHADTRLPDGALSRVAGAVEAGAGFGCFALRIDSGDARLALAARLITLRSRLLCSATGDQAIFVRRELFDEVGGFPEIDLCEDLALMRILCGRAPFQLLEEPVTTSARRWQRRGLARTVALMWAIRFGFHLGVPPRALARLYPEAR
jgi:rSAM/selenodomain-associated transferase 2